MKRTIAIFSIGSALLAGHLYADVQPLQQGSKVQLGELPGPVQATVKSQSGGANIEDVERGTLSGRTVYEIAFKQNGKHNELRVAEDGTVVDRIVEGQSVGAQAGAQTAATATIPAPARYVDLQGGQKVQMSDVPPAVQNAIKTHAAGASIEDIDRGTFQGRTVYEAAFKQNGKHNELRLAEDGTIVARYVEGQNLDLNRVPRQQAQAQSATQTGIAYNEGFKETFDQTRKVNWDTLPQHVRQAIRERAGAENKILDTEVGRTPSGRAYQVAYKRPNGKHAEIRVSHDAKRVTEVIDGRVVFWVAPQQFSQVPQNIQRTVRDRLGSIPVERVQQGAVNNQPFYRFNYTKNGQPMELRLERDGSNVQEMAVGKSWIDEPAGAQN